MKNTIGSILNSILTFYTREHALIDMSKCIHRIDETGIIKVADFGLSKSVYDQLYFRQDANDSVKLPIKWLAVESIEDGVFSEKTDVV